MKNLVLITLILYSGLAGAQTRLKEKVDRKTGDTIQMTRETMLWNPILKNLAFGQSYKVGWRVEKLMVKGHRADTLLFFLHIYGGGLISNTSYSPLFISFADGHTLTISLRNAFTNQYGGVAEREGDGTDTYATYVLRPDDINEIVNGQIRAIKVTTLSGPIDYTVNANSAHKIPQYLSSVAKAE
jgi:hypothetical protein